MTPYGDPVTTTTNRYLILAAAAALSVTLASCSGDSGGEETSSPDSGAEQTTADDGETSAEETTDAGDDGAAGGSGAECLVGTWTITPEALEEQILASYGGNGEVSVEGTNTVTFDGETYTADFDSTATFDVEMEGVPFQGSTASEGTFVVSYTADDSTVSFGEVQTAEGTITTDVGGQQQELPLDQTASALEGFTQDYTCTDTELTIITSVPAADGSESEVEQVYTRV